MAEEVAAVEEEGKKPKSNLIKIILAVVGLVVVIAGTVVGTLFASGFFKPKPPALTPEERLQLGLEPVDGHGDAHAKDGKEGKDAKDGKDAKPGKVTKKSPEAQKFEFSYHQMEREFLVNITGSKKVMSIQVAVMTRYDQRVVENVKKHEFALRSVMMDVMRQTTEADLSKPEFRVELAKKLRDAMNTKLESFEDFGGVEEVFFTSFIVQ